MKQFLFLVCSDFKAAYENLSGFRLFARGMTNSSLHACILVRAGQCSPSWIFWIWRRLLISCHGMDVGRGVSIGPAFSLPHPVGIVIGRGVTIGARCAIFQGVTLGRARDKYPRIGSDVVIYPNAIIVGDIDIPDGTRVRALSFLPESRELCIGQERYNREG